MNPAISLTGHQTLETLILKYGDLIYDITYSTLWSTQAAQKALLPIFKELNSQLSQSGNRRFEDFELEWTLHIMCRQLKKFYGSAARRLSPSEQLMLDSAASGEARAKYFESFFHLLSFDDQVLFLLTDKHGLTLEQACNVLLIPRDTLILKKALALRTLYDSIWPENNDDRSHHNQEESFMPLSCFKELQISLSFGIDRHCQKCDSQLEKIKFLLDQITKLTKHRLPNSIRSAPLQAHSSSLANTSGKSTLLPGFFQRSSSNLWKKIPWWIRTGLESVGIAFVILFVVALLPKLRSLYEQNIEKKLTSFNLAEFSQSSGDDPDTDQANTPIARGRTQGEADTENTSGDGDDFADESATPDEPPSEAIESSEGSDISAENKKIHVGQSEIWRFMIKTDSPHDVRPKIVAILIGLKAGIAPNTAGGVEAPGGIQFDLIVPSTTIPILKTQLERLSTPGQIEGASTEHAADPNTTAYSYGDTFTWYKRKSAKKLPAGKARVVVWLSQM